jgi:hypothetical protein
MARSASRIGPIALLVTIIVAGCGTTDGPTDRPASSGPTSGPSATETIAPPQSFGPPPSPTEDDGTAPLMIDASLLDLLPERVAGIAVVEDLDEATQALSNSDLQTVGSAIDAAVAVDAASANLAYALVVRLRTPGLGAAFFRDWRDSYDEGACAGSGLAIGHAEAEIDGRTVYIGTCEGGIRTYHVLVQGETVLISSWSLGEGNFGEALVSNLRVED